MSKLEFLFPLLLPARLAHSEMEQLRAHRESEKFDEYVAKFWDERYKQLQTAAVIASLVVSLEAQSLSWDGIKTAPWIVQALLHCAIDMALLALASSLWQTMSPTGDGAGGLQKFKGYLDKGTGRPPWPLLAWLQFPFYLLYLSSLFYGVGHFLFVVAPLLKHGWAIEQRIATIYVIIAGASYLMAVGVHFALVRFWKKNAI